MMVVVVTAAAKEVIEGNAGHLWTVRGARDARSPCIFKQFLKTFGGGSLLAPTSLVA
jgi:hypothetical protein